MRAFDPTRTPSVHRSTQDKVLKVARSHPRPANMLRPRSKTPYRRALMCYVLKLLRLLRRD